VRVEQFLDAHSVARGPGAGEQGAPHVDVAGGVDHDRKDRRGIYGGGDKGVVPNEILHG